MNHSNNHNTFLVKKKVQENDDRNCPKKPKFTSDDISLDKNDYPSRKTVESSLTMLNNCAKEMIEDFKSKKRFNKDLSGSWEDHYRVYNENINKLVHNMLKYSSDYKKKMEPMKTSSSDRRKKIEILLSIKEQFGPNI